MKTILSILTLALFLSSNAQQKSAAVKGMHKIEIKTSAVCDMCKETIEYDLAFEKGVKSAVLDVDSKILTVIYKSKKTSAEQIRKRVTKVGYNADGLKRDPSSYDKLPLCCKDGAHSDEVHSDH